MLDMPDPTKPVPPIAPDPGDAETRHESLVLSHERGCCYRRREPGHHRGPGDVSTSRRTAATRSCGLPHRSDSSGTRAAGDPTAVPSTSASPSSAARGRGHHEPVPAAPDLVRQLRLARADDLGRGTCAYVAGVNSGQIILDTSVGAGAGPEPDGARDLLPAMGLDEHPAERDPRDDRQASVHGRDQQYV